MLSTKITLFSLAIHVEATAWKTSVVANGGTVSDKTLRAVSDFCNAMDVSGLRSKIYRLNLFCGTGLLAAVVPLYLSTTYGGTVYGNSIDTNTNFVEGDYGETTGLKGNGTTKILNTGIAGTTLSSGDRHIATYDVLSATTDYSPSVGAIGPTTANMHALGPWTASSSYRYRTHNTVGGNAESTKSIGFWVGSDTSTSASVLYKDGASVASTSAQSAGGSSTQTYQIFGSLLGEYSEASLGAYSIGLSMTASQVSNYYNIINKLQTELGRTDTHVEAQAWKTAVVANGGTVSDTTLRAVSKFCKEIDAEGLRSKMYRVNLFAGTQLAAALVPLYRSASYGGTAYGTSVDTNVNFVVGDYIQASGLTGGSTKYLNLGNPTGLMPSWATHHIGVDTRGYNNANHFWMGAFMNGTPTGIYSDWATINLLPRTGPAIFSYNGNSATQNYSYFFTGETNANLDSKLKLVSRTSSTNSVLYNNASSTPTNTSTVTTENGTFSILPAQFNVFSTAIQSVISGVPSAISHATYEESLSTFRGYTIGLSLTEGQVSAYNNIWATFRTAMGRP